MQKTKERHFEIISEFSSLLDKAKSCMKRDEAEMKKQQLDSELEPQFDTYFEVRTNLEYVEEHLYKY